MTTSAQIASLRSLAAAPYRISNDVARFEPTASGSPVKLATAKSLHDKGLVVCDPAPDHDPRRAAFKTRWSRGTTMTITEKGREAVAETDRAATICNATDGGILRGVLEQAAAALRIEIRDQFLASATGVRNDFVAVVREAGSVFEPCTSRGPGCQSTFFDGTWTTATDRELDRILNPTASRSWNRQYRQYGRGVRSSQHLGRSGRRPATDAELAAAAEQWADEAIAGFIAKMLGKFGGFGEVTECVFLGGLSDNAIRIQYRSGLSFNVRNKIVLKCSSKGTLFNQYPCTFHDVAVNGVVRKNAGSERAVKLLAVELS